MTYESTITFTLDTICPWTYISLLRLRHALSAYQTSNPSSPAVNFTLCFAPFQLYPDFSTEGVDKYAWYRDEKYNGSEDRMATYMNVMRDLGRKEGVEFEFKGTLANTLNAHRVLYVLQEEKGCEVAVQALMALYEQFFERGRHPSSLETLAHACREAGLSGDEADLLVKDQERGASEVKRRIREQEGDGVDSVPYVVFDGRKRDFTLVGAKEVEEYVKVLRQVEKEAS